jgi:hypothetical protein
MYGSIMSSAKTLRGGAGAGELASLLAQLDEKKGQVERLLARVEEVLRGGRPPGKSGRVAGRGGASVAPARKSPLDQARAVMQSTADLREANGNLSAVRVAKAYGVSLSQLAGWLGRTKQAVSKTPDADSLQEALGYFERVARVRLAIQSGGEFRRWLRTPHELLDNAPPLELMAKGEWRAMADYVDDMLTGAPT